MGHSWHGVCREQRQSPQRDATELICGVLRRPSRSEGHTWRRDSKGPTEGVGEEEHEKRPTSIAILAQGAAIARARMYDTLCIRLACAMKRGRAGRSGGKLKMSLGFGVATVLKCADNSGAKSLYVIFV